MAIEAKALNPKYDPRTDKCVNLINTTVLDTKLQSTNTFAFWGLNNLLKQGASIERLTNYLDQITVHQKNALKELERTPRGQFLRFCFSNPDNPD